jgi:3-hydroxybutyryl-CoA dehydrogenase
MSDQISTVGVVGCGTMGSGISEVCARAGYTVVFREVTDEAVEAGLARIRHSLDRAVEKGKLPTEERDAVVGRIRGTTTLEGLKEADVVVEASSSSSSKTFSESSTPCCRPTRSWRPTRPRSP